MFSALPFAVAVPIVPLFGYGAAGRFPAVLWWAWPIGALLAVATHLADALPDVERDRATGVRGLATRLGVGRAAAVAAACYAAAVVMALWSGLAAGDRPVVVAGAALAVVLGLAAVPAGARGPGRPPGRLPAAPGRHGRPRPRLGRRRPSLTRPRSRITSFVGLRVGSGAEPGGCGSRLPPGRLVVLRFSGRSGDHEPHRRRAPRRSCMVLPALDGKTRCRWAATDPVLATYHDNEWGEAPVGDAGWFERLSLEVFQAGLSWRTVLAKRDGFRRAFHDFEPKIVAAFTAKDVTLASCATPGIVRNRAKVLATIENAKVVLALADEHGSFGEWVAAQPDDLEDQQRVYRQTFQFAGPQVVEAFLQSVGRVPPPHEPGCWRLD